MPRNDPLKELADLLEKGLKAADEMPDLKCPGCGRSMTVEIGGRGYTCFGSPCVLAGRRIDISEIVDSWKWNCILEEAATRNQERKEMLERNGAHEEDGPGDHYCVDCCAYHPPTLEHPLCPHGGYCLHASPPANISFDYKGWIFTPPFICMCCGIEVCERQWAFSRSCGACDVSESRTRRLLGLQCFVGPHRLSDPKADGFIQPENFVDPAKAEEYPRLARHLHRIRPPRPARRPPPRCGGGV